MDSVTQFDIEEEINNCQGADYYCKSIDISKLEQWERLALQGKKDLIKSTLWLMRYAKTLEDRIENLESK